MGTTTDGQICFGVVFEDGSEFPWHDDEDSCIEDWWRSQRGFKAPFEPWGDDGERVVGVTQEQINDYFDHRNAWDKDHPLPVSEVNYCSGEYPMIILAVQGSLINASRGYPTEIFPQDMGVDAEALKGFCEEFGLEISKPKWWLSSYWG